MKLAVITGASSGIGLAATEDLIKRDFTVVNLSRRVCPNSLVHSIQADLSKREFINDVKDELEQFAQNADAIHLIHNAARYLNDSALDTSDETLEGVLQTNILAPNALNRTLIPYMRPGSSIIVVGSTLSEKAVPGCFTYVTSKHAQVGLMRSLCQDLVGRQIHTVMICPGFTDTEMLRSHVPEEAMESIVKNTTFGRLITPEEIAQSILWAIDNPVLNGSVIHANLGQIEN